MEDIEKEDKKNAELKSIEAVKYIKSLSEQLYQLGDFETSRLKEREYKTAKSFFSLGYQVACIDKNKEISVLKEELESWKKENFENVDQASNTIIELQKEIELLKIELNR